MQEQTRLLHAIPVDELTGAIATPIYQTSTFVQELPGVNKGFDYSRSNNPTRKVLEDLLAEMEGGVAGFAFASGLAAVDVILKTLQAGDEIVAVQDIYGGTFRTFERVYSKFGITVKYVDTSDAENVVSAVSSATKLVWLETPTNPTLKISDIQTIAKIAHDVDAYLVVDNTFASPALQKPISFGADIIVHSATKYLAGHSDVIAGAVVVNSKELADEIKFYQNASGSILGPFDSWLTIRGIETLSLRINQQSDNALEIAMYLSQCEEVDEVFYPGLVTHKNYDLARKQQSHFGGIVSFTLKEDSADAALQVITSTRLFKLAESLGGVKSLICHPATMTHKGTPPAIRRDAGVKDSLIRLSCGIEAASDLMRDLRHALNAIENVGVSVVTR